MSVMLLVILFFCVDLGAINRPLKILHMSFHEGCIKDIEEVGRSLGFQITPWLIQRDRSRLEYDGETKLTNDIYNITQERAEKIWRLNKDYFDQFDLIMTSDTAPLSRIFLQNGWNKPLIIWICNRFDYADGASAIGSFPDEAYYDLFRKALKMANVRIVSYTRYEHVHARRKGVEVGNLTINPVGRLARPFDERNSAIPNHINKSDHFFLYPRLETQTEVDLVRTVCSTLGIKVYHGTYNGPEDLTGFRGVIYFPYAWSNLALFENLQQGIVHFVPSEKFIQSVVGQMRVLTTTDFELCDWWSPEFRDYLVYFDSFIDMKHKIEATDYIELKTKILHAGLAHRAEMLERWQKVFDELLTATCS